MSAGDECWNMACGAACFMKELFTGKDVFICHITACWNGKRLGVKGQFIEEDVTQLGLLSQRRLLTFGLRGRTILIGENARCNADVAERCCCVLMTKACRIRFPAKSANTYGVLCFVPDMIEATGYSVAIRVIRIGQRL